MQLNPNNSFLSFILSEEQQQIGGLLNPHQKASIQNLKAETAEQLIVLKPVDMTAQEQAAYWQQEAFLQGQLAAYDYLLVRSDAIETASHQSQSTGN